MSPPVVRAPPPHLPREQVLASAGTGKTYILSSRLIGLLAQGAPPEGVLAATFTRKAAGEILTRVLTRLAEGALHREKAAELAVSVLLPGTLPGAERGPHYWRELLERVLKELPRLNVGTLDSFFLRVARSFPAELALPPHWEICDEQGALELASEALQDTMGDAHSPEAREMVRALLRNQAARSVHARLLGLVGDLRDTLHQVDPEARDPWCSFPGLEGLPPSEAESARAAAAALEGAELPLTRAGTVHKGFQRGAGRAAQLLREGRWEGFCAAGLPASVLDGSGRYHGLPVAGRLRAALEGGLSLARAALAPELARRVRALERLARSHDEALTRLQWERGAYRFEDITYLLGKPEPVVSRPDLWYRLDQRAQHLLLDEFQDTALAQWEVLRPLVKELLSGHGEERAAVLVADPKQSIYGWRGAEPELVHRVGSAFTLQERTLRESWRSSQVVLGFVNRVFRTLEANPVWSEEDRSHVRAWCGDFHPHLAARDLPGRVQVTVGPRDGELRSGDRPRMMEHAAELVRELALGGPHLSVGVLTRQNQAVARLAAELRERGVEASEEGGTHLADTPAASALLALLRLADHPGDTVARYLVARSPLGPLAGLEDHQDGRSARREARRIRERLMHQGYGPFLSRWVHRLGEEGALSRRDLERLLRLCDLGYRWDERSTLRPRDFVRFVERERVQSPSEAGVRIMTIHQAKGLEFDAVVLPELDLPLVREGGARSGILPLRDPGTGRIVRVFPALSRELSLLFREEMGEALRQNRAAALRDALGILYVGLTRARRSLHLLLAADPPGRVPGPRITFSHLLRRALGWGDRPLVEGETLFEDGRRDWAGQGGGPPPGEPEAVPEPPFIQLLRRPRRRRFLPHDAPSSLEGTGRRFKEYLSLRGSEERGAGSLLHAWLRELRWAEDWDPDPRRMEEIARRETPELPPRRVDDLWGRLELWLRNTVIRGALSRSGYPAGARVQTELPFAVRLQGRILHGQMDRVVLVEEEGRVVRAEVLDYKTDHLPAGDAEALQERVERYRPQMEAYRHALARLHGLGPEQVAGRLVFLVPGEIVPVGKD